MLNVKMLNMLVCPLCKGPLVYESNDKELICNIDRLAFPFQGDVPVMLKDEARSLGPVKQ